MRLSPTTYTVDATDNTNPKLIRTQAGATNVIAEQIIGFKVPERNGYTQAPRTSLLTVSMPPRALHREAITTASTRFAPF